MSYKVSIEGFEGQDIELEFRQTILP